MKTYFKTPITTKKEGEDFFRQLHKDNLLYHPEDSAHDIIEVTPGTIDETCNTFSLAEADELDKRMDEVFDVLDDPCEFILDNLMGYDGDDDEFEGSINDKLPC
jgi:hypothetical protein